MSKEQYVTFEVARLLKEKGFDWFTYAYYTKDDVDKEPYFGMENLCPDNWNGQAAEVNDLWFSAPTQQMAMRWLREKKMIFISPFPTFKSGLHYSWRVDIKSCFGEELGGNYEYITYEDAVDAALLYVFQNLI
jgi:hypothetical protein